MKKEKTEDEIEAEFNALEKEDRWSIMFTNFAEMCKAVVCCRVSPSQKAEVCKCVKKYLRQTTLCIGDGANDVAMILEAHVGVGIAGVEGSQAVNNADFALCKFRDLENIVLCHGRWAYKRLGYVCLYILYKNITFCLIFAVNGFYSGFSGQLFYDEYVLAGYNVLFTALPAFAFGFFEQDLSKVTSLLYPISYRPGQESGVLNLKVFLWFVLEGIYQAIVIFYMQFWDMADTPLHDGTLFGLWDAGNAAFTANLFVVTGRICMDTRHFTYYHTAAYLGSIVLWFVFILPYCAMEPGAMGNEWDTSDNMYYSSNMLAQSALFWCTQPITVVVCLLPTVIYEYWLVVMTPNLGSKAKGEMENIFYKYLPKQLIPNPKSDESIMYHLRHYMMYPLKYVTDEEARNRLSQSESTEEPTETNELLPVESSISNRWKLNQHSAGYENGSWYMDIHLGNKHVHSGSTVKGDNAVVESEIQ